MSACVSRRGEHTHSCRLYACMQICAGTHVPHVYTCMRTATQYNDGTNTHTHIHIHSLSRTHTYTHTHTLTETPGMSFLGRTSTLKMRMGTANVATALGTSTMPETTGSGFRPRWKCRQYACTHDIYKYTNTYVHTHTHTHTHTHRHTHIWTIR